MTFSEPPTKILTIYKSFIRPHIEYGDILYNKKNNENLQSKIEKVQYRACVATTGAIQGISKEKTYNQLGLHSLRDDGTVNLFFL